MSAARMMVPPRPSARSSPRPSDRSSWRWRLPLAAVLMTVSAWFGLLAWKTDSGPNARTAANLTAAPSESPSDWALTTYTKSIERVAPGELVPEDRLHGDNDLSLGIVVDPPTWRRIVLRCPKTDGSHADGDLLRPGPRTSYRYGTTRTWLNRALFTIVYQIAAPSPPRSGDGGGRIADARHGTSAIAIVR
ncbi:MAG: hypothetical protein FJ297_10840 [Planctomycetes bacterium]|nr:hypothetical protein [Planctomycetota bacterium]